MLYKLDANLVDADIAILLGVDSVVGGLSVLEGAELEILRAFVCPVLLLTGEQGQYGRNNYR